LLTGNATFTGYILPVLLLTKLPVIYRHGEEVAGHSLVHKALNLILYRRVNQNIANCSFLVNRLKKRFNRINIKVIYNLPPIAVGTKKSSISASSIKVEGKVILLYVGQITVQKGVPMLLEAFKELLKRYHNLELHLIGDVPGIGNTKENATGILLSQYQAELPDQLFYHGRQEETSAYYQFSDIHICPSIYGEHSANVIFEAKYHALPSVIFAVGGLPELIDHQRDGYICHDITPSALADGIEYFLENTERRHQAGLTARSNLAEKYGVERFKQQWVRILDAASEQHGSRQKDVT
jgi:glycosyltransferase involved in cell wall biosynthesis